MTSDRRTFLGAGLGIAAAATSRNWGLTANAAEMPSRENIRAEASTDFGHLISQGAARGSAAGVP